MSTDRKLEQSISKWLEAEAPRQLPDRVLRATFERTRKTKQQGRWRALVGRTNVNRFASALGGATVVVVVAAVAIGLYFNQPGIGAPASLPDNGSVVEPGRYSVTVDGYRYTFRVPTGGWKANVVPSTVAQSNEPPNRADVELTQGDASNDPPDLAGLGLWGNVRSVHQLVPPCSQDFGFAEVDGTAGDLATALAYFEGWRPSEPTDVTVGRYSGKRLQLTVPGRVEFDDCPKGEVTSFRDEHEKVRVYEGPDQVDEIWILDLENGDRQLFLITYFPTTPAETVDELRQIVESVEIAPDRNSGPSATQGTPEPDATVNPSLSGTSDGRAASFDGNWESIDADGSHQTMAVHTLFETIFSVTIHDESALVCNGTPSRLSGLANVAEPGTAVIEQPDYTCDDGSQPEALSGPPLHEQLRALNFRYGFERDVLQDSLGVAWTRI